MLVRVRACACGFIPAEPNRTTEQPSDWTLPVARLAPTVVYMSIMTQTGERRQSVSRRQSRSLPAPRARLITGHLALLLLSSFGALTSFYLLLSVTPMFATGAGAGSAVAGLVTGSLMLATVLAEFASARLMRRYGYRTVFAAGALLLGGPTLALLASHGIATIIAVSVARGIGFGLNTVVIGALVASALPPERRGEGIGLSGVVESLPAIIALPSGVWLAKNTGYPVVIALTAASALAPLAAVPWLAGRASRERGADPIKEPSSGLLDSLRAGGQLRPSLVFAATTVSAGVVVAFVPLAAGVSASAAALGLLVQAAASTVSRWWAGRHGDRYGHGRLLVPALLVAAAGMTTLIWVATPAAMLTGMCLFGIGFGITENATFAMMIDRVPRSDYGTASALWSLAYDGGYGAGPAMFGVFVVYTGYPAAFALTGTLMLAALVPALRDRTAERHAPPEGTRLPAQVPSAGVGSGSGQRLEGVEQRDATAPS
jgi:MFS family permease